MDEQGTQTALVTAVSDAAQLRRVTIAAAESVTAGHIASALAIGENASEWFMGSVVAYRTTTKQRLLRVTEERVITAECAAQMLLGVLDATRADVGVSTTGAGGPDPEEDQPPGTVFICAGTRDRHTVFEHHFDGPPAEVVSSATSAALEHLRLAVAEASA